MTCPHQPGCGLASTFHTAPALRVWQTFYCESGFQRCARLTLLRAGSLVPSNLLPNGTWLAAGPAAAAARR
ncbi:MAG TPA: hypothetical protein VFR85_15025 [Anaeromyxobacteraceae bacterium]|nr:hypothetical protein [Anaeromyxobacteraceae bacterium]